MKEFDIEIYHAALNFNVARTEALEAKKQRNSHKCEWRNEEYGVCRYDYLRNGNNCEECDAWTSQDLIFREKSKAASRLWSKYKATLKKYVY